MKLPEAFFLTGPTASGKSTLAHRLALRMNALLVSADSMNLYRGMNIGTAKPSAAERSEVDYAGLDLAEPETSFSTADWLAAVRPVLLQARRETRPVIVAGGTGLYLKCLLLGLAGPGPADPTLRKRLEALNLPALQAELQALNPERLAQLADPENPRRLIRAIEMAVRQEPAPSNWTGPPPGPVTALQLDRAALLQRIEQRVEKMYARGLLDEARTLMARPLSATARQAIGYAEAFAVLRGTCSQAEAIEQTVIRTRRLAKRQMTWLRNQLQTEWIAPADFSGLDETAEAVYQHWQKTGPLPVRMEP